ncbi:hypothetical protein M1446_02015 [Candidatus Dependentiae bacterium]|nr:hypothetical protein [Candidatus Dependentiae bacterium]
MKYILKATLIVASISSLNAGYLETALSYANSGKQTASQLTQNFGTKAKPVMETGFQATKAAASKALDFTLNQASNLKTKAGEYAGKLAQVASEKAALVRGFTTEDIAKKLNDMAIQANSTQGKMVIGGIMACGAGYGLYKYFTKKAYDSKRAFAQPYITAEKQKLVNQLNDALNYQTVEVSPNLNSEQIVNKAVKYLLIAELTQQDIEQRKDIIAFLKTLPAELLAEVNVFIKYPAILPKLDFFKKNLTNEEFDKLNDLVIKYCEENHLF